MSTPGSLSVSPGGAANYTIPIQISPGTGGMQPSLALGYNSQGSNGSLGIGWTLAGLSVIHRCAQTIVHDGAPGGINHDANDRYCLDGQRLIVVNGLANGANNAEYRTERETLIVFTRLGYVVAGRVGGESKVDPARSCIKCR